MTDFEKFITTVAAHLWPAELAYWALACALVSAVAVGFSFVYVDIPVARFCAARFHSLSEATGGIAGPVLIALESVAVFFLVFVRVLRGQLSPLGRAILLACLCSICAYAVNTNVLKIVFGVPNVEDTLQGTRHLASFLHGSNMSSFPSGHMALAGAFGGVFMRLYRKSIVPLSLLLLLGAVVLVAGNWHFVSDVIAGTFFGVSVGILAGELWMVHVNRWGLR